MLAKIKTGFFIILYSLCALLFIVLLVQTFERVGAQEDEAQSDTFIDISFIQDKDNGRLSNKKNRFAYSDKPQNSWINQDIYIRNLNDNTEDVIKIRMDMPFQISSWSQNDNYLFVYKESDYYGGLEGRIIDLKKKKPVFTFRSLNQTISWLSDTQFLYFEPTVKCTNKLCTSYVFLKEYDLKTKKSKTIGDNFSNNQQLPLIKSTALKQNSFEFGVSREFHDYNSEINEGYIFDLNKKIIEKVDPGVLLVESINQKLEEKFNDTEILSVDEMPDSAGTYRITAIKDDYSGKPVVFEYRPGKDENINIIYGTE